MFDSNIKWIHYFRRPFSLYGASLWHQWYSGERIAELFGTAMPDVLFIEDEGDTVRCYRPQSQLRRFILQLTTAIIISRRRHCLDLLRKADDLNKKAVQALAGQMQFSSLPEAIDFFVDIGLLGTVLPYFILEAASKLPFGFKSHLAVAERLRAETQYPAFFERVVVPQTISFLRERKVPNATEAASLVLWSEIQKKDFSALAERQKMREQGKRFVYQSLAGVESVHWATDIANIVTKIEKPIKKEAYDQTVLKGHVAYPGRVRGRVRILFSVADIDAFQTGEILVTINSNPSFMPAIRKAAAIVSDEGGITCHAAIVSRELGIPCVIGTRIATKVFQDGDTVEVDAEKGIVRKLS